MADDSREELELTGPGGTRVRARGYDLIAILLAVGMGSGLYMLHQHTADARDSSVMISQSLRELAVSQRETACVLALPQDQRMQQFAQNDSWCKRVSR